MHMHLNQNIIKDIQCVVREVTVSVGSGRRRRAWWGMVRLHWETSICSVPMAVLPSHVSQMQPPLPNARSRHPFLPRTYLLPNHSFIINCHKNFQLNIIKKQIL